MVQIEKVTNSTLDGGSGAVIPSWTNSLSGNGSISAITGGVTIFAGWAGEGSAYIYQTVDLTGVTSIDITHQCTNAGSVYYRRVDVYIDGTLKGTYGPINCSSSGVLVFNVAISGYTGNHTLMVGATAGEPSRTSTNILTISALATVLADFTVSNSTPMINTSVTFTSTSQGASSYLWDFGDGTTSTDQNPTKTYTSGGAKTVTLKINGQTTGDYVKTATVTVQDPMILARSGFEWL